MTAPAPRALIVDGPGVLKYAYYHYAASHRELGYPEHAAWGIAHLLATLAVRVQPTHAVWIARQASERLRTPASMSQDAASRAQADFADLVARVAGWRVAIGLATIDAGEEPVAVVASRLAHHAQRTGMVVALVTRRMQLAQLVGPTLALAEPAKGPGRTLTFELIGAERVTRTYGVRPAQIADYLALVGDEGDGIPGVPGIGPKTAVELLTTYGTLDSVLEHAALARKRSVRTTLLAHRDLARTSYARARLPDAPPNVDDGLERSMAPDLTTFLGITPVPNSAFPLMA